MRGFLRLLQGGGFHIIFLQTELGVYMYRIKIEFLGTGANDTHCGFSLTILVKQKQQKSAALERIVSAVGLLLINE